MAILIDETKRVLVQGITGREGQARTRLMLDYGTRVVGGVTPGKGGQDVLGVPVFDNVREAVQRLGRIDVSVVFVPAAGVKAAAIDAIEGWLGGQREDAAKAALDALKAETAGHAAQVDQQTAMIQANTPKPDGTKDWNWEPEPEPAPTPTPTGGWNTPSTGRPPGYTGPSVDGSLDPSYPSIPGPGGGTDPVRPGVPSVPGGMARQYRVQVRDTRAATQWRLVANFGNAGQACDRAVELTLLGQQARVVACRSLPTAA